MENPASCTTQISPPADHISGRVSTDFFSISPLPSIRNWPTTGELLQKKWSGYPQPQKLTIGIGVGDLGHKTQGSPRRQQRPGDRPSNSGENWGHLRHLGYPDLKLQGVPFTAKATINIVVAPRESWAMKPREPLGDNSTQGVGHSILWRIGAIYSNWWIPRPKIAGGTLHCQSNNQHWGGNK